MPAERRHDAPSVRRCGRFGAVAGRVRSDRPGRAGAGIPAGRRVTGRRGPAASAPAAGRRPAGLARDGLKPLAAAIVAELVDGLVVAELVELAVRVGGVGRSGRSARRRPSALEAMPVPAQISGSAAVAVPSPATSAEASVGPRAGRPRNGGRRPRRAGGPGAGVGRSVGPVGRAVRRVRRSGGTVGPAGGHEAPSGGRLA